MSSWHFVSAFAAATLLGGAACGPSDPPQDATWADVQPILRASCGDCHGSSAFQNGGGYRFDFYDMATDPCGAAATVLADASLARAQADRIARAITTTDPDVRPAMPPLPAPYLSDDEWLTILRWTANPIKGDKPPRNRPPHITVDGTSTTVDETLELHVIVTDPESDPVVGVVSIGGVVAKLDHAGAFSARYDASAWPAGALPLRAVLCDGWSQVSVDLLEITVRH
jgi:hypothetical protein